MCALQCAWVWICECELKCERSLFHENAFLIVYRAYMLRFHVDGLRLTNSKLSSTKAFQWRIPWGKFMCIHILTHFKILKKKKNNPNIRKFQTFTGNLILSLNLLPLPLQFYLSIIFKINNNNVHRFSLKFNAVKNKETFVI